MALTWGTFWIPPGAIPARAGMIVTNLLSTLILYDTSIQALMKVDYRTAMEYFMMSNGIFILAAMSEYVFILNWWVPRMGCDTQKSEVRSTVLTVKNTIKVTGDRPMAPVLNRGPLEVI